jgi:hypothetical protein
VPSPRHSFIAVLLFSSQKFVLHAESPEMWVVPLEHRIPSKTPDGHQVTSLGFVVRFRGAGDYKAVDFFNSISIRILASSGKALEDDYSGNLSLPTYKDVRPLKPNEIAQKAYVLLLREHTLVFIDLDGIVHHFQAVTNGKYRVVVTYDDTLENRMENVPEFEDHYDVGDQTFFFRGPVTKSFQIVVGVIGGK